MNYKKFLAPLKNITNWLKNESELSREARATETACKEGSIQDFEKYYNKENTLTDLSHCALFACIGIQLEMYKYLITKPEALANSEVIKNYESHLIAVSARDSIEMVRYILSEKFPKKVDMYYDNSCCMRSAISEKNTKVIEFFLYDKAYVISPQLQNWIIEKKYTHILEMIEKRDLLFNLEGSLASDKKSKVLKL